jgi:hypothetical protein
MSGFRKFFTTRRKDRRKDISDGKTRKKTLAATG